MRTVLLALVFFVAFAGEAADKSRKTTSIPPRKSVGRYTDATRGFSISLPAGWATEQDKFGTAVMAISKKESAADKFQENINVVVETLPGAMTPKAHFDASQNAIKKIFQGFSLGKTGKEKIANHEFYWAIFSHRTPDASAKVLQFVSVNGLRAYVITCSAAPEKFDRYKSIFEASAKSFKFEQ